MSCDSMELSSDSDLSEIFGEIRYKSKNQNTYKKRRLLSRSSESDSENIEELSDIDPRQFLWSAQNLAPKELKQILTINLFFSENMIEHIVRESNNYYTTKTIRNRHSRLKYIPSKQSRFGIKSYVIRDCYTGYIQDFIVYCGARTDIINNNDLAEIGKSGNIVKTLMEPYLNKCHVLVTDNWYSSPALFSLLHHNKTNAFGTVKKTKRGMANISNKLCKGEIAFQSTDKLLALKWMDKKEVLMLSSYHSAEYTETKRNDVKTPILKPSVIVDYNRVMGAVDKTDMILNSINTVRKTKTLKWYKKFFFHMLDLSIYNAYILYKITSKKNITLAKFHLRLIREILLKCPNENICSNKSGGQTASKDNLLRLVSRHFPSNIPIPQESGRTVGGNMWFAANTKSEPKLDSNVKTVTLDY
ncbi:unnamed protein product, partial [Heterotrigona itama]